MTVNWVAELIDYSDNVWSHACTHGAKYVAAFCGALAVALVLTPLLREAARKIGMVDQPDARRIHKVAVPRGGGLAVFVAFHGMLGALVLAMGAPLSPTFSYFWQGRFLLASSLLVAIGLVDDKYGMKPLVKLAGQIGVASLLYLSGVHVGGIVIAFPPWLDYAATVFWIVGAVNAFNLIDGMDGLAAGLAFIAALGLAGAVLFTGNAPATLPYLVLAGACLGFLRYNFHPASVFLGDTGSMFLGLCVATLPLMTGSRKELVAALGVPLLAMGIPIFDTMLAIWRRSVRTLLPQNAAAAGSRMRLTDPDKDHMHHRLLRDTLNQRTVALTLYAVSAVLVLVGLGGTLLKGRAPGLFLIAFIVAIFVVVRHLERVELWDTGRLLSGTRQTLRQGLLIPLYIVADVLILCAAWGLARLLAGMPVGREALLSNLLMFVAPVFVFQAAARIYVRVWSRAQVHDFAILVLGVVAGTVTGLGLAWLFGEAEPYGMRFAVLFAALAVFPMAGIRLWRDCVRAVMQVMARRILLEKPETLRMLAYGGGLRFRSYLREMAERSGSNDRVIIGVVDDDLYLKGRYIAGHTVLGGFQDIGEWVAVNKINGLVITCLLTPEKQAQVIKTMKGLGIKVWLWSCEEVSLADPCRLPEGD